MPSLIGNYSPQTIMSTTSVRTPHAPQKQDRVSNESKGARARTETQPALLGRRTWTLSTPLILLALIAAYERTFPGPRSMDVCDGPGIVCLLKKRRQARWHSDGRYGWNANSGEVMYTSNPRLG